MDCPIPESYVAKFVTRMTDFLVDTDVLIDISKGHAGAADFVDALTGQIFHWSDFGNGVDHWRPGQTRTDDH
jgi:hypothetical protein